MERSLIVARMGQGSRETVARIWSESDAGELPGQLGVTGRWLFGFHDLYFHLVEAEPGLPQRVEAARNHPLYADINNRLAAHITAYDPQSWRGPRDAMAENFYTWRPGA
jgi:cyclase